MAARWAACAAARAHRGRGRAARHRTAPRRAGSRAGGRPARGGPRALAATPASARTVRVAHARRPATRHPLRSAPRRCATGAPAHRSLPRERDRRASDARRIAVATTLPASVRRAASSGTPGSRPVRAASSARRLPPNTSSTYDTLTDASYSVNGPGWHVGGQAERGRVDLLARGGQARIDFRQHRRAGFGRVVRASSSRARASASVGLLCHAVSTRRFSGSEPNCVTSAAAYARPMRTSARRQSGRQWRPSSRAARRACSAAWRARQARKSGPTAHPATSSAAASAQPRAAGSTWKERREAGFIVRRLVERTSVEAQRDAHHDDGEQRDRPNRRPGRSSRCLSAGCRARGG